MMFIACHCTIVGELSPDSRNDVGWALFTPASPSCAPVARARLESAADCERPPPATSRKEGRVPTSGFPPSCACKTCNKDMIFPIVLPVDDADNGPRLANWSGVGADGTDDAVLVYRDGSYEKRLMYGAAARGAPVRAGGGGKEEEEDWTT